MPVLRTGSMRVGKIECYVHFYGDRFVRSGVGAAKLVLPEDNILQGKWVIDVNFNDVQRFIDELGVDDLGACGLVVAHEFGHVILLEMGMTHEEQFREITPTSEWLAWQFAWPILKRMEKGISFMGRDEVVFPETSHDVYRKARAMGLQSHHVNPEDQAVRENCDTWFRPRVQDYLTLIQ